MDKKIAELMKRMIAYDHGSPRRHVFILPCRVALSCTIGPMTSA